MPLTLILGAAGSGKTETCLDGMARALAAQDSRQSLILLVPEQATHQTERAALERFGSSWRVHVLSFRRLAFRTFQDAGGAARPPITELGRKMVLRSILARRRADLSYFGPLADRPGLLDHLSLTLRECRAYEKGPAALFEAADEIGLGRPRLALPAKLRDLALIMTELETHLEGRYTDPDQTLTRLAERLPAARVSRGAQVWVDGFSGFTPQEYRVLGSLLDCAAHVHATLCIQTDHRGVGSGLFEPTLDTRERLITLAIKAGHAVNEIAADTLPAAIPAILPGTLTATIPAAMGSPICPPRFRLAPGIAHVEREFFASRPAVRRQPAPDVTLIRAAAPRVEVTTIAQEILRLCREDGLRFRDIAVVVRDLESYYPIISAVFADHGIPAFIDRRRGVAYHSLVELVRSAVEAVASDWPYEALFRFLKTDLAAVSRPEADRLENVGLQFGLRGHSRWTGDNWPGPRFLLPTRDRAFGPLARFHERVRGTRRMRDLCTALYRLLEELEVPRHLGQWAALAEEAGNLETASEHLQVYDAVLDLLDQVVEALGDTQTTCEAFLPVLEAGLSGLQLGLVPPSLDQVVVGSVERSRHPELRAVFVAGAIEGAFPRASDEDLVIDDAERTALAHRGFDLGPTSRDRLLSEPFAMYLALTRASDRLYISYPQSDSAARGQAPSVLWTRTAELLPECRVWTVPAEDPGFEEVATVGQLAERLAGILATDGRWPAGTPAPPDVAGLYHWLVSDPDRLESARHALSSLGHDNQAPPLPDAVARALYGSELLVSASRLEKMAACPFQHYAHYALQLSARPVYRVEPVEIGQFLHGALERFVTELKNQGVDLAGLDAPQRAARIGTAVISALQAHDGSALLSTGQSRHLVRKLERALGAATGALAEHARRGRFRPTGLEVPFGPDQTLPPIDLQVSAGRRLAVRGRIDRIDAAQGPGGGGGGVHFLLVMDYKRASKDLSLENVAHGLDLQMPLYLVVATRHGAALVGLQPDSAGTVVPAGMLYFPVQPGFTTFDSPPQADEVEAETLKAHKTRGLLHLEAAEAKLFDSLTGYSPIVPIRLRKDGSVVETQSHVATPQKLGALLDHALARASALGEAILDGQIDIAPFRLRDRSACTYCDYRPVCRFDPQAGERWRDLAPLGKDGAWLEMAGG